MLWLNSDKALPENGTLVVLRIHRVFIKAIFDLESQCFVLMNATRDRVKAINVEWTAYLSSFMRFLFK